MNRTGARFATASGRSFRSGSKGCAASLLGYKKRVFQSNAFFIQDRQRVLWYVLAFARVVQLAMQNIESFVCAIRGKITSSAFLSQNVNEIQSLECRTRQISSSCEPDTVLFRNISPRTDPSKLLRRKARINSKFIGSPGGEKLRDRASCIQEQHPSPPLRHPRAS